ncbi:MAG: DUF1501 domain-containing protein [Gemmataceae bacterium]|nr:DUF1501 domain-containing protein [Gemmataceae bacterium]MDW8267251.1 DUF1501 domain-containing protein [Gemmataceae bacterium]
MLRILGSRKHLCDGWSRREFLWASGLGLLGLTSTPPTPLARVQGANRPAPRFGQAKACILLFLYGSPSQLETWDMKPDAPEEIRGEMKPIRSSLPGLDICEYLPRSAKIMDRVTVVRSMTHPYPIHGVAYATTGVPHIDVPMELNPRDSRHWPFVGSVVDYLTPPARRRRDMPVNLALPFPFSSQRTGEVQRAGPYAAWLGGAYNPVWTEFHGTATRPMTKRLGEQTLDVLEPYVGITADSRLELASGATLPADITLDRLNGRKSLLEQFDQARRDLDRSAAGRDHGRYRSMAYDLIASERIRTALDVSREPMPLRESYGMTLFGQAALTARRLVEAGARFVTVFWDEYGLAGSAWDTHWDHYPRMKEELLPGLDMALYGLISDLNQRGMLEETLVWCMSEHGRTPKLKNVRGGGRDHWSRAYSLLAAGGGIARGRVVGRSDKHADSVADRPVSPKDILATTYHLLGIDPQATILDRLGRPMPLVPEGEVVAEMLA